MLFFIFLFQDFITDIISFYLKITIDIRILHLHYNIRGGISGCQCCSVAVGRNFQSQTPQVWNLYRSTYFYFSCSHAFFNSCIMSYDRATSYVRSTDLLGFNAIFRNNQFLEAPNDHEQKLKTMQIKNNTRVRTSN